MFNRLNGIGGNFGFECLKALCEICPTTICFDVTFVLLNDSAANVNKLRSIVDSDDVQELLDSDIQDLEIDELIEMHEQELDVKDLESLDPV
ncbi:hypothetical protein TNCV_1511761 [Trichonephila clavipes]|nr:hypothetical protein TNCV_1511761 [Trichonephila clavipes]